MSQQPLSRLVFAFALGCGVASSEAAAEGSASAPVVTAKPEVDTAEAPQMTENADKTKRVRDKDAKKDDKEPEGWHREGFALKKGKSKIELAGYIQGDFRHFDWKVKEDETEGLLYPESEIRRARLGAQAVLGHLTLEIAADPRDSEAGSHLKDATVGYQFSKHFNVLVGHFKPPFSQEFLTSASKTDFVERAPVADLAPDRDWGAAASGEAGRVEYAVGGFVGDGDGAVQRGDASGALRLSFHLFKGFSAAGSFMRGTVEPDARVGAVEPPTKGTAGKGLSGFTYWNRAHVKGTRQRLGTDFVYTRGPFRARGEVIQLQEQRKGQGSTGQDIPDIRARAWTFGVSYVVTGEKKGSSVEPSKSIFQGGKGALEVVARAEGVKFDDVGDPSGFAGYGNRARNIAPSGATMLEAGLNYWPSNFIKLQGSALWESYNDPLIAPVPGNKGRYFSLLARVQVMIP